MPSSRRLVVAIDYGTSNSGAAYALFDSSSSYTSQNDIEVIRNWPNSSSNRNACHKVPSDILYDPSTRQPIGFGFDVANDGNSLQWVKLLLEPDGLPTEKESNASRVWRSYEALDPKHLNKQPVDAVADYLSWLWSRVRKKIQDNEDDEDLFDTVALTVVLTVPASWTEKAKYSMRQAAKAAGIPETAIRLVSEPEAAAIFSLKKHAKRGQLKKDDCVIICDAGGGTVDVVAYQIRTVEPLSLSQVTMAKGDFCGSAFIDAEFHSQIQSSLGRDYDLLDCETKARIEDEFEFKIKRSYSPDEVKSYYLPVTGLQNDESRDISNGKMKVDSSILATAFDLVMTPIMTLIDGQIDALREKGLSEHLRAILLVGGFSGSDYLHNRIRQEFPKKSDTKIWRSDETWTAVVQGAVACELSGSNSTAVVHSRLSSYNYGVPYSSDTGRKVKWLVRKGQPVQTDMETESYGLRMDDESWLDEETHCLIMVNLVRSDEDEASDEYGLLVTPHAEIECRVPTHLRRSKDANLIQEFPKKAWHIPADLVLFLDGAVISFRCRIQGQIVGVTNVAYFEDPDKQDHHRGSVLSTLLVPSFGSRSDSVFSDTSEALSPTTPDLDAQDRRPSSISARSRFATAAKATSFLGGMRTKREGSKEKPKRPSAGEKFDRTTFVPPAGLPVPERNHSKQYSNDELQPWRVEWPGLF